MEAGWCAAFFLKLKLRRTLFLRVSLAVCNAGRLFASLARSGLEQLAARFWAFIMFICSIMGSAGGVGGGAGAALRCRLFFCTSEARRLAPDLDRAGGS